MGVLEEIRLRKTLSYPSGRKKTKRFEGWRSNIYTGPRGIPHVGYGFNLEENREGIPEEVLSGARGLSREEAEPIFNRKYDIAEKDARAWLGNQAYETLDEDVKEVVNDLSYNLGRNRLGQFKKLKKALTEKDYNKAAEELKDSEYFGQTGRRSKSNYELLKSKNPEQSSLMDFILPSAEAGEMSLLDELQARRTKSAIAPSPSDEMENNLIAENQAQQQQQQAIFAEIQKRQQIANDPRNWRLEDIKKYMNKNPPTNPEEIRAWDKLISDKEYEKKSKAMKIWYDEIVRPINDMLAGLGRAEEASIRPIAEAYDFYADMVSRATGVGDSQKKRVLQKFADDLLTTAQIHADRGIAPKNPYSKGVKMIYSGLGSAAYKIPELVLATKYIPAGKHVGFGIVAGTETSPQGAQEAFEAFIKGVVFQKVVQGGSVMPVQLAIPTVAVSTGIMDYTTGSSIEEAVSSGILMGGLTAFGRYPSMEQFLAPYKGKVSSQKVSLYYKTRDLFKKRLMGRGIEANQAERFADIYMQYQVNKRGGFGKVTRKELAKSSGYLKTNDIGGLDPDFIAAYKKATQPKAKPQPTPKPVPKMIPFAGKEIPREQMTSAQAAAVTAGLPRPITKALPMARITPDIPIIPTSRGGVMGPIQEITAGEPVVEADVPPYIKKVMEKGVEITDRGTSILIDEPIKVKDIHGKKVELPKGEEYTPFKLSNGKIWLHDGKNIVVDKGQFQQVKGQGTELKPLAIPGETGVTTITKSDVVGIYNTPYSQKMESDYGWRIMQNPDDPSMLGFLDPTTGDILQAEDIAKFAKEDSSLAPVAKLASQIEDDFAHGGAITEKTTKFEQFQLPGGKDYKETLLMAEPEAKEFHKRFEDFFNSMEKKYGKEPFYEKLTLEEKKTYDALEEGLDIHTAYKTPHWDEPNVVAHIRHNTRTTPEGKKVLFIEEIQSDWAREGRKKGFGTEPLTEAQKDRITKLELKEISTTPLTDAESNELDNLRDLRERNIERGKTGVPYHPAVKEWKELAGKEIVRMAIEGNYDAISWTTGQQQADRYDLSKKVGEIRYNKETYQLQADDIDGTTTLIDKKVAPEKLAETIGKDAAEKILKKRPQQVRPLGQSLDTTTGKLIPLGHPGKWRILKKHELRIGGEWAKSLYDTQLPSILKKITGGEAGKVKLALKPAGGKELRISGDEEVGFGVFELEELERGGMPIQEFNTQKEARDFIAKQGIGKKLQPSITLTPEIKAHFLGPKGTRGMPGKVTPPGVKEAPAFEMIAPKAVAPEARLPEGVTQKDIPSGAGDVINTPDNIDNKIRTKIIKDMPFSLLGNKSEVISRMPEGTKKALTQNVETVYDLWAGSKGYRVGLFGDIPARDYHLNEWSDERNNYYKNIQNPETASVVRRELDNVLEGLMQAAINAAGLKRASLEGLNQWLKKGDYTTRQEKYEKIRKATQAYGNKILEEAKADKFASPQSSAKYYFLENTQLGIGGLVSERGEYNYQQGLISKQQGRGMIKGIPARIKDADHQLAKEFLRDTGMPLTKEDAWDMIPKLTEDIRIGRIDKDKVVILADPQYLNSATYSVGNEDAFWQTHRKNLEEKLLPLIETGVKIIYTNDADPRLMNWMRENNLPYNIEESVGAVATREGRDELISYINFDFPRKGYSDWVATRREWQMAQAEAKREAKAREEAGRPGFGREGRIAPEERVKPAEFDVPAEKRIDKLARIKNVTPGQMKRLRKIYHDFTAQEFQDAIANMVPAGRPGKPPRIPRGTKVTLPGFFEQKFRDPTLVRYLTPQDIYIRYLGLQDSVGPLIEGKTRMLEEKARFNKSIDILEKAFLKDKKVTLGERIRKGIKNIPVEAKAKLWDYLHVPRDRVQLDIPQEWRGYHDILRDITDTALDRVNIVRKRYGIEPIRFLDGYIMHIKDALTNEAIKKKYPLPADLEYWLSKIRTGKIFNPTAMARISRTEAGLKKDPFLAVKAMMAADLKDVYLTGPSQLFKQKMDVLSRSGILPAPTRRYAEDFVNIVIKGYPSALDKMTDKGLEALRIPQLMNFVLKPFGRTWSQSSIKTLTGGVGHTIHLSVIWGRIKLAVRNHTQKGLPLGLYPTKHWMKGFLPESDQLKTWINTSDFYKASRSTFMEELPKGTLAKLEQIGFAPYGSSHAGRVVGNVPFSMRVAYHAGMELVNNPKWKHLGWTEEDVQKEMDYGASTTQYWYNLMGMPELYRHKTLAGFAKLQSWWMNYTFKFWREMLHRGFTGKTGWGKPVPPSWRVGAIRHIAASLLFVESMRRAFGIDYRQIALLGVLPQYLSPAGQIATGLLQLLTAKDEWQKKKALRMIQFSWKAFIPGSGAWKDVADVWQGKKPLKSLFFHTERPKKQKGEFFR